MTATGETGTINVLFVGGGKGCYEILEFFESYLPKKFKVRVIGVADPNPDAIGRRYAAQHGIATNDTFADFLHLTDIDLVIELTGDDEVLSSIFAAKHPESRVLDHLGASFLWEIIAMQEDKIHLERRMVTLDTTAAIGELAYRLTHEIRNPLMIVGGSIRRAMTRMDVPHGLRKRLKLVAGQVQKMEEIVSDVCDVVRPLVPDFQLRDLNLFFQQFCKAARVEARYSGAEFTCDVENELPTVFIDQSLLRQALWHLLENSIDAARKRACSILFRVLLCYDYLLIQIEDSCGGLVDISPDTAMAPFATTRPGRMGLGLTLCRQIVMEHGGNLEIRNMHAGGTTAIIKLPLSFRPLSEVSPP